MPGAGRHPPLALPDCSFRRSDALRRGLLGWPYHVGKGGVQAMLFAPGA